MSDGFSALFWGVFTFSLLVVIHEGGHFLAARAFGVKVHEFMVGLPGPAVRFHGKQTTYGITAIPLGGYVRIAGMEPGPEDPRLGPVLAAITARGQANPADISEELGLEMAEVEDLMLILADWDALHRVTDSDDEYLYRSAFAPQDAADPDALLTKARSRTYRALPTWKRLIVLSAGVVMNLLTAIVVFTFVLSTYGYYQETMRVDQVSKGSGAAAAGIMAGDKLLAVEGKQISTWQDLILALGTHRPGETVAVKIERDGDTLTVQATLGKKPDSEAPLLGVQPQVEQVRPNVLKALALSFSYIGLTFEAILRFFNPQTFQSSVSQSSSVIGASYLAAEAAKRSAIDYAGIVAMLSLSLGVINIVPIPPLDGGKIAVELVERARRRPLSRRVSIGLSASGAILLFALIGYLMYADVVRYIVGG